MPNADPGVVVCRVGSAGARSGHGLLTYDGTPHTATVSTITGVNGETGAAVGTVPLNTTPTNANPSGGVGQQTLSG